MKKTIFGFLLALSVSLAGCAKTPPEPTPTPGSAVEDQLAVLAEKLGTLENEIDWLSYEAGAQYAVTDLDGNGLLELVVSSMQGTGLFTTSYYYEVNEDSTGVTEWTSDEDESFSEPDLLKEFNVRVYLDDDGVRHYILSDYLRNGAAEDIISLYSAVYNSGRIEYTYLAGKRDTYNEEKRGFDTTYTDADGNEITWEEFDAMADTVFSGMERKTAVIGWAAYDSLADHSQEELLQVFRNSYEVFRGE